MRAWIHSAPMHDAFAIAVIAAGLWPMVSAALIGDDAGAARAEVAREVAQEVAGGGA